MKTLRSMCFLVAALVAASPALGADLFTINVPVEFKSLNSAITGVEINCHIQGKDPVTFNTRNFGSAMGKSVTLPVTGGNYTGPSPVAVVFKTEDFSSDEQKSLSSVTGGTCHFTLNAGGNSYQPYGGETSPTLAQKPGAPFKWTTTFTFPK